MAAAVCGMHYTGMEAATFKVNDSAPNYHDPYTDNPYYVSNSDVEIPVLLCAMFVLWSMVIIILSDLRSDVHKYQLFMKRKSLTLRTTNHVSQPKDSFLSSAAISLYNRFSSRKTTFNPAKIVAAPENENDYEDTETTQVENQVAPTTLFQKV